MISEVTEAEWLSTEDAEELAAFICIDMAITRSGANRACSLAQYV